MAGNILVIAMAVIAVTAGFAGWWYENHGKSDDTPMDEE